MIDFKVIFLKSITSSGDTFIMRFQGVFGIWN